MNHNGKVIVKATKRCGFACKCSACGKLYLGFLDKSSSGWKASHSHVIRTDIAKASEDADWQEAQHNAENAVNQMTANIMKGINDLSSGSMSKDYKWFFALEAASCEACQHPFFWNEYITKDGRLASHGRILAALSLPFVLLCLFGFFVLDNPLWVLILLIGLLAIAVWIISSSRKQKSVRGRLIAEISSNADHIRFPLFYDGSDPDAFAAAFPGDERAAALLQCEEIGSISCYRTCTLSH